MFFKYLPALFVTFLLLACGGGGGSAGPQPVEGNQWTVMIYMAADNDLEISAPLDIQEMQALLGQMYNGGMGIPADKKESIKWYKKSAAGGNIAAKAALGMPLK